MSILLWILIGAITVILAVLILPLDVTLRFSTRPGPAVSVSLQPFSGRMRPITLIDTRCGRPGKHGKQDAKPREKPRRRRRPDARFLRELPRLFAGLVSAFQIVRLRMNLVFGLGDPADTGKLYGALAPLAYGLGAVPKVEIGLHPDFGDVIFSGEVDARLRVRPVDLIKPALGFLWRLRWWRA
jgi:Protein of unknown function (DUF2953)